jgi:two-component system phosphate regulon sensor histidine kinase PhoR
MAYFPQKNWRGRFFRRVFSRVGLLLALGMFLVSALTWRITEEWLQEHTVAQLVNFAHMAEWTVSRNWSNSSPAALEESCKIVEQKTGMRMTLIDPSGAVLADSDKDPATMENHASRPEVVGALHGTFGRDRRLSASVGREFVYVAVPLRAEGRVVAVVRVAAPAGEIHRQELALIKWTAAGLAVALPMALVIAWFVSRALARPVQRVGNWARRLATGDLETGLDVGVNDEVGQVAESLEQMRVSLAQRIQEVQRQRQDLAVTLGNLEEGVVAVNAQGVVLTANDAARRLLGIDGPPVGWPLTAGLREPELARVWGDAVSSPGSELRREISLNGAGGRRTVDVIICRVSDADSPISWLLCVRDITVLARSAAMKADFVANASHELRTPVAAIRAAVETLGDDGLEPSNRARFIGMIERNAQRLTELTEDLMQLNRVESASPELRASVVIVDDVFAALRQIFEESARRKGMTLTFSGGRCEIATDRRWLELALKNLLDNAVKFADQAGHVEVRCRSADGKTWFEVEDDGCGIPPEDLDRVFERFYQVDKSRGRSEGGTGLGLAIVKHAVHALGGEVSIRSEVGRGTTVSFWLPVSQV